MIKPNNRASSEEMRFLLWCHHFVVALWMLSHGAMSLQESIEQFILSPGWGKVRRSRIRGSRAAANHQNAYYVI